MSETQATIKQTKKDFMTTQDVRWCPGCGDYAILAFVQRVLPELGIPRENYAFISGIGCSSRFPYYMNTYGLHTVHGRAPTIATGVKVTNPNLDVWVITGDGDALSIGGNHLMHCLRRNVDLKILLFNNRIYGLTKGQYSPTSETGKITKSTPKGSIDYPVNPLSFALGSEATFVARTIDSNAKHMMATLKAAALHKGTAFVEIFQNCIVFNGKAWDDFTNRDVREDHLLFLEDGQPMIFGKNKDKGIRLNGFKPEVVDLNDKNISEKDLLVHDSKETDPTYSFLLSRLNTPEFPVPVGVFRSTQKQTYHELVHEQVAGLDQRPDPKQLQGLINGNHTWQVD